jgi:hypothetical protein
MKKTIHSIATYLWIGVGLILASCATDGSLVTGERDLLKPAPLGAASAVLLDGHLIGVTNAKAADSSTSDCEDGKGYGVQMNAITGDKKYLYDRDGEPCAHSQTLFDGKMKVHQRTADPSVNITFIDKYGKLPEKDEFMNIAINDVIDMNMVPSETPEDSAMAPYTGAERMQIQYEEGVVPQHASQPYVLKDKKYNERFEPTQLMPPGSKVAGQVSDVELSGAINRWKEDNAHREIVLEAEKLLAGVRNLSRKSSDELLVEHQNQIKALLVQLRGAEKVIDYQKEKERRLRGEIEQGYRNLVAEKRDKELVQRKATQSISQKEQRAYEYEQIAHNLKRRSIEKNAAHRQQMQALRTDLAQAEVGASETRQKLILQAAQKIAEAEAIASAARLSKREAMEREANRLSIDASYVMRRAMEIDAGEKIVIPAFDSLRKFEVPAEQYKKRIMMLEERLAAIESPQVSKGEVTMTDAPTYPMGENNVVLKSEDETLDAIMQTTLTQLSDRIGDWQVEWRLSKKHASIANEKWTVIAEARFDEFLAYVQEKVKRFDNGRLFVITDQ